MIFSTVTMPQVETYSRTKRPPPPPLRRRQNKKTGLAVATTAAASTIGVLYTASLAAFAKNETHTSTGVPLSLYKVQPPNARTFESLVDCFTDEEHSLADSEFCLDQVYQTAKASPGIEDLIIGVNETMLTCKVTGNEKVQKRGCEALTTLAFDVVSMSLGYMILCTSDDDNFEKNNVNLYGEEVNCGSFLNVAANQIRGRMERCEERYFLTPLKFFVAEQVGKWRKTFLEQLLEKQKQRGQILPSTFWRLSIDVVNDISQWVRWNAWQANHFLWVQDVIEAKQVVHTEWGNEKRWEKLGANDANNTYPLPTPKPRFFFSEKFGMRWEIVNSLLSEYGIEELRVVEVGVFAGHFSKFLLEKFPKLQLIGIDPYIGTDETFPGDYSQTLDPSIAYSNAMAIYEESGPGRATLWPTTSLEAVKNVPDQSIHAVFVDGCHFYHCVEEDLRLWIPKIMPGGLVLGHDFSPQWPGVVRAVWENRPNQRVFLAMDWMYWWQIDDEPEEQTAAMKEELAKEEL
ncbi:unnamed protein product [Amoebophrya sp. A120]|nr:unnamed protein product [Amoebophrya sp. A120]|eukprot:GSA120T00021462001.1